MSGTQKFDPMKALKYGVNNAILLSFIEEQLSSNSDCIERDGCKWVKLPVSKISKSLPYLNVRSINRWLSKLEDAGEIKSEKINSSKMDMSKYYSI